MRSLARSILNDIAISCASSFDDVERRYWPLQHVVFEAPLGEARIRVNPGDHKNRVSLRDRPTDERISRTQVEDVELVNPRRHDEERHAPDLVGEWAVLDELHHLVLENHLAEGRSNGLANPEGIKVAHGDGQGSPARVDVSEKVGEAVEQVPAAALKRGLQHLGVGRDEVRRSDRVDKLARVEIHLTSRLFVEAVDAARGREDGLGRDDIALLDVVEDSDLTPGRVSKAGIGGPISELWSARPNIWCVDVVQSRACS